MIKPIKLLSNALFSIVITAVLSITLLAAPEFADAEDRYGKQKVVYHINFDNPKRQKGALINIQNHINAVGKENLDLKVVLHGNGLALLLEPDSLPQLKRFKHANADLNMTARVDELKLQGVEFNVCQNTIRGRKVDLANDMYDVDDQDVVPSGVAEVARLQMMGYAYIKP